MFTPRSGRAWPRVLPGRVCPAGSQPSEIALSDAVAASFPQLLTPAQI